MDGLDAENQEQIIKYLKFFKNKRDIAIDRVDGDFDDCKSDRLHEDMYTKDDVEQMLDHLNIVVKDNMRNEVQTILGMNVLLMKQLFERAVDQGCELQMDTSVIEDAAMISAVEKIRLDQPVMKAEAKRASRNTQLSSMKDDTAELVAQKNKLETSNATLQERFTQMQSQMSTVLKQKTELERTLAVAKDDLESSRSDFQAQAKHASDDLASERSAKEAAVGGAESSSAELQRALAESRQHASELERDMEEKLTSSKQFQQMKRIMTQKTQQVTELRRRLQRHEPDALLEED